MMRTEAPKDLAGRGFVNFARTTPELPTKHQSAKRTSHKYQLSFGSYHVALSPCPR